MREPQAPEHLNFIRTFVPMRFPSFQLKLAPWVEKFLPPEGHVFLDNDERMRIVIELAKRNVQRETGGPFGAAIFDINSRRMIAPGVNMVSEANSSILHAEMVAFLIAQQKVGHYDLGGEGLPPCELVCSTEPCSMCFGAIPWSGVRRVVCGARDEDARRIGFDEGPKLENWVEALEERNIAVVRDVCRDEARKVLEEYKAQGGIIYNGRRADAVT